MDGESCLSFAPNQGDGAALPPVIIIPPLFDEMNRMRRTLVLMMRALAAAGHAVHLPDLPGQNDSLLPTHSASLNLWRDALSDRAARLPAAPLVASWRGGALIDDVVTGAVGWWRMAPLSGSAIVKSLLRMRIASDREAGVTSSSQALRDSVRQDGSLLLGGNNLSLVMLDQLEAAAPATVAPLRSASAADMGGSPLWLRAEPGEDAVMARNMAADISSWARQCVAG